MKFNFKTSPETQKKAEKLAQISIKKKCRVSSASKIPSIAKKAISGMKETLIKKFGVDNCQKLFEVREKMRKTNLEKYGCEYGLSSEIVKNKRKKTLSEKYGVINISQLPWVKAKKRKIAKRKYGVSNTFNLHEVRRNFNQFPNKKEEIILNLFPKDLEYSNHIPIDLKNRIRYPDFIVKNNPKWIIEHFGTYWHGKKITKKSNEQHEKEVLKQYSDAGYHCLIIWENELSKLDKVKNRIQSFLSQSVETTRKPLFQRDEDIVQTV
jgi:hypothetical protein